MMIDLNEEDIFDIHPDTKLTDTISNEDIVLSQNVPIVVRYNLIDMDKTDYHFRQDFIDNEANLYFERMREFSTLTINEIEKSDMRNKIHFYRNKISGNLKRILQKIDNKIIDSNPLIFHFALDSTSATIADRKTGDRNPRIYFMLGVYGAIHILFFDPYHEINP